MAEARIIPIAPRAAAPAGSGGWAPQLSASRPLSLYVHFPWCVHKCPYSDFNSHEANGTIPERDYVDALIADLQSALPLIWGRPVVSVFFGGGTPSLLSPAAIDELLAAFRALAMLAPDAEITLEANPGTVEAEKFAGFRAAGVNRLSLAIRYSRPPARQARGRAAAMMNLGTILRDVPGAGMLAVSDQIVLGATHHEAVLLDQAVSDALGSESWAVRRQAAFDASFALVGAITRRLGIEGDREILDLASELFATLVPRP